MDLVGYDQAAFDDIVAAFSAFAAKLAFGSLIAVPVSATNGDNIVKPGGGMPWYDGPTLLQYLESVEVEPAPQGEALRFPVQWVNRSSADFRGFAGTVAGGRVRPGDAVVVTGTGATATVARIVTADGDRDEAQSGDAVTLTLAGEIDVARGDLITGAQQRACWADHFAAHLLWMDEEPLLPGRSYLMRVGTRWVPCRVSAIKHKLDVHNLDALAARTLERNEVGFCNLMSATPVAFDAFQANRSTGAFILVDRYTDRTVAAGTISFPLRRATNVHQEQLAIGKSSRARLKGQRPCVVWFTGLPASGKSTVAKLAEARLHAGGYHTYMLDGDNLRHGLNSDLGFTDADRVENIRRVGEVAKLFVDAGLIVLCAFISPFRAERQSVRELFEPNEFLEIFVDTPIEECVRRDPKGLYAKAQSGAIKNFTGFDSPYERPTTPELVLTTASATADQLADQLIARLRAFGHIGH
jgi:bifunctional enzyme CysN/CysC